MAISKGKADVGQGGKLGHSNMEHWESTAAIKEAARNANEQVVAIGE